MPEASAHDAAPWWWGPTARALPEGVAAACAASAWHFLRGMTLLLVGVGTTIAAGLLLRTPALAALGIAALIVLLSVVVHEVGHVLACRLLLGRGAPITVIAQGLSCHVVRLRGTPRRDVLITIAGPVAPLPVALGLLGLTSVAPFVPLVAIPVAVGHIAALVLPVGDGANLRVRAETPA